MQLHAFPVDLLKDRVEYELERGIWPSFGRNFLENIFSCEACRKQTRKQGSALCIRKTFSQAFFRHANSHFYFGGSLCTSRCRPLPAPWS